MYKREVFMENWVGRGHRLLTKEGPLVEGQGTSPHCRRPELEKGLKDGGGAGYGGVSLNLKRNFT